MNISVIGVGYVGLVTGVCLAELGNKVVCMDIDDMKIKQLNNGKSPIYEPGLLGLIKKNLENSRIDFTNDFEQALCQGDLVFVAVDTPSDDHGNSDLSSLLTCISSIGQQMKSYKIIIIKSTIPVGTTAKAGQLLVQLLEDRGAEFGFDLIFNPEFLREGTAVDDFMHPERVVVGVQNFDCVKIMQDVYKMICNDRCPLLSTTYESAEMIKFASNAFLATKISFINEISDFCQASGANVNDVSIGMGLDSRIGQMFLKAGPGFGGSCFPKDTRAIVKNAGDYQVNMSIVRAAIKSNSERKHHMVSLIKSIASLHGQATHIAVLGAAFKANTDDVRESPALGIISELLKHFKSVRVYDPQAMDNAKKILPESECLCYTSDAYKAAEGAQMLIVLTEWSCFRNLDFKKLHNVMQGNVVVDLRNLLDKALLVNAGFNYIGLSV